VSTKGCVTCHMPKIEIPGMHARFTDHWIRTVKSGETIPH
jgi:formate-dependent nitrite reductase cytochrome c552 subunit